MTWIEANWILTWSLLGGFVVLTGYVCWLKKKFDRHVTHFEALEDCYCASNDMCIEDKVELQKQIDCVADGGHYYKFEKPEKCTCPPMFTEENYRYLYFCKCGHKRLFKLDDLCPKEQKAIKALNLD